MFVENNAEEGNRNIIIKPYLGLEYVLIGEENTKVRVALGNNKEFLLGSIFFINISESNRKNNSDFVTILEVDNIIGAYGILDLLVSLILEYKEIIAYFILLVFEIIYITAELKLDFLQEKL
jgi:hypothetical protein